MFKKFLLYQPQQYRKRLKKQLEFLEIGMWDSSVRVKKIKGVPNNKTIFEARLDKGNRIIFTIGFDESSIFSSENKIIIIYIWGIVSHDDISNKSKTIIPANAPFLKFSPVFENETQDLNIDELDNEHFSQEYITKKISDDSGSQKWHRLNETDWERIELYTKDDFDLYLYLTPYQIDVLKSPPPLLVSGTAGSGKTTLGVYYLLKESIGSYRKLFITYNKYLKIAAERLYKGLLNSEKSAGEYEYPDFFTYKEFCLSTVNRFTKKFVPENEINYERFAALIQQNRNIQRFDIPLIWEEFRAIIKGALPQLNVKLFNTAIQKIKTSKTDTGFNNILLRQFIIFSNLESAGRIEHFVNKYLRINFPEFIKNFESIIRDKPERVIPILESILELFAKQKELTQKKHLSFLEYEMIGKKKAPNFNVDRKEIYKIFEWYQDKLETEHLWDELDLTKEVMTIYNDKDMSNWQYDLVICDEVQDLTDIQHELLFNLVKNPLNLILTGDTKQIINPSGFRWEELKQHFYERNLKIPEISFLNLNFRSSGSIVELSNCLLEIKTELLGLSSDQHQEDWKFKNRPPVIIAGMKESEIITNLRITGAGKTILVRTEEEKENLKVLLETELIFTIGEAKGLEFDTVFLWKFCSEKQTADIWGNILSDNYSSIHSAKIKHEINLLYVAITRAQKDLIIYDGLNTSVIWKNKRIGEKVFISDDMEFINNIWNVISTSEEWLEQGNYYFEREYYLAAIECYKNAGANEELFRTEAFYFEKKGNFIEAAKRFELLGDFEKAANYFEKCNLFAEALVLWVKLGKTKQINNCKIIIYETEKNYKALADLYIVLKEYLKAAEYYFKDKNYLKAAELFNKLKKYENAAINYEFAGALDMAAPLYAKVKKYEKAADLFEKIQNYEKAEVIWKKTNNVAKLVKLYTKTNNFPMLLKYYAKINDSVNVIKLLRKNYSKDELLLQAEEYLKVKNYLMANLSYSAAGNEKGIAITNVHLKKYLEAADYFERNNELYMAGETFMKARNFDKAFICFIQSPEDKNDGYLYSRMMHLKLNSDRVHEIVQKFFSDGKYDIALQCSLIDNNYFNAAACYANLHKYDEAAEMWSKSTISSTMDSIVSFCVSMKEPELCAKVLFKIELDKFFVIKDQTLSNVISIMDKYFLKSSSHTEMLKWAERLNLFDSENKYLSKVWEYYQKSGEFNALYKNLQGKKDLNRHSFENIKKELKKLILDKSSTENEMMAIACDILDKKDKAQKIITKLELKENNYLLFLTSPQKEEAIKLMIKFEDPYYVRRFFILNNEYLKMAEYFELENNKEDAAHYYAIAKDYKKSIELFISIKKYQKAGDIYFKLKDYNNAIKCYSQQGKNELKIADALVKLGEFQQAEEIYRRKNKKNKIEEIRKIKREIYGEDEVQLSLFPEYESKKP
ncbi:MAG: UvrD-helicase domain-containing protein [bacterium]